MRINFWGVRGSLPIPELYAWRYGGNTPCLEVRASNQLLILDAGRGIRDPVELVLQLHTVHNGHSGSADKRHSSKESVEFCLRGCVVRTDPQATKNGWVGVAVHFPPSPLIEAHQPSQEPASPPGDAGPAPTPRTMAA